MVIGVPKETFPGEKRIALVPSKIKDLKKLGCDIVVQSGAGELAGYPDQTYTDQGAKVVSDRGEVFKQADIIFQIMGPGANPAKGSEDYGLMKEGQILVGQIEPLTAKDSIQELSKRKVTSFSLELLPRITRAQSMDVLSSMANIAGYKAVIWAADHLPRVLPMMTTPAGTLIAAKVFIVGVGVAGLQAIATAKRLGAVVQAYDVRPAVKEQVMSLGAKFVEMELDASQSEDKGGYAKEMGDEFYKKQRELMTKVVAESDIVITTASIPGKKAPILVTTQMVDGMKPGSVIVDLAAERGGNCESTKAGEIVNHKGISILGPVNIASTVPYHTSQMFSSNLVSFVKSFIKDGKVELNMEDEVVRDTLVTKDGQVVNTRVKEALGI